MRKKYAIFSRKQKLTTENHGSDYWLSAKDSEIYIFTFLLQFYRNIQDGENQDSDNRH